MDVYREARAVTNRGTVPREVLAKTVLTPVRGWQAVNLAELWRYRELTGFLALRDIRIRYKQTALGVAWAVIQPVMNTIVFTLFFNRLAGVGSDGRTPYPLFALSALLPWQLFENSLTQAGNSLIGSQNLITKVYFPRLTIPLSSILSGVPDFGIGLLLLAGLMVWYKLKYDIVLAVGWPLLLLPLFILLALALALGVGLWLSALNVQYRDVRYAIPFLTRLWFFATPIVYPASKVGKQFGPAWETAYGLNPMAGVVEGFRWALLGDTAPSAGLVVASAAATALLLAGGFFYFRRMEQTFADVV